MSSENSGEVGDGYTRREALKLGFVFGGGVLTGQIGPEVAGLPEVKAQYTEGDIIQTPVGDLTIEGWQIHRPSKRNDDPDDFDKYRLSIVDEFGSNSYFENGGGSYSLGQSKSGKPTEALPFYPSPLGDPITLILNIDSKVVAHHNRGNPTIAYSIKPRVYTENGEDSFGLVLAQEPIDPSQLAEVAKLRETFEPYVIGLAPIYVFADRGKTVKDQAISGGSQDPTKGIVEMYASAFTNPVYEGEALGTAFHELSHDVIRHLQKNSISYSTSADALYELQRAYKPIAATYKGEDAKGALTELLTESTYIQVPGKPAGSSRAGHPQDNLNEMFASTMTVMRFHTKPFLAAFDKLEQDDQRLISDFVSVTLVALEESGGNSKDLRALLPTVDIVKKHL